MTLSYCFLSKPDEEGNSRRDGCDHIAYRLSHEDCHHLASWHETRQDDDCRYEENYLS